MQEIKSYLKSFDLSEDELKKHIAEDSKLVVIKMVKDKTGLPLLNAKDLVENFQNGKTYFEDKEILKLPYEKIGLINDNGQISVELKLKNKKTRRITPADPEWELIKKTLGPKPALLQYEKEFLKNPNYHEQKKSAFFKIDKTERWKYIILIIVVFLFLYFFLFFKF